MITIKVFRSGGGQPQANKVVKVHGKWTSEAKTDSRGVANFENLSRGNYNVYVDGRQVHKGLIIDVQVVYV